MKIVIPVIALAVCCAGLSPALADPPSAQCLSTFPGPAGRACCTESYAKNPEGTIKPTSARTAQVAACVKSKEAAAKKKS